MAYIDIDIDVDEFLDACSRRDIKELIQALVENDHLPKEVLDKIFDNSITAEQYGGKYKKRFIEFI